MKPHIKELIENLETRGSTKDRNDAIQALRDLSFEVAEANARAKLLADSMTIHAEAQRDTEAAVARTKGTNDLITGLFKR